MLKDALIYALPILGWWLLTGIINLAFGYRSQIEAWAESRPNVAALLKLTRALGLDPWNLLSSLKLLAQKRLPDAQKSDSPIAKLEQRKADLKRLGVDKDPPEGGAGTGSGGTVERMFPPSSVRPPGGMDAEMRRWGGPFAVALLALCLVGCNPRNPPCDEAKMRAVDAAYLAEVGKRCLQYASAAECPELPELRAKHSRELREVCP